MRICGFCKVCEKEDKLISQKNNEEIKPKFEDFYFIAEIWNVKCQKWLPAITQKLCSFEKGLFSYTCV